MYTNTVKVPICLYDTRISVEASNVFVSTVG